MKKIILIPLVISVALSLGACSQGGSSSDAHDPHKKTYEGNVFEKAQELYKSAFLYDCDTNQIQTILKITKTIEDQRKKISELNRKRLANINTENIHRYKIGPHEFYDLIHKDEPKDEWIEVKDSWKEANEIYEGLAHDYENTDWALLNNYVRSLISDDTDRIEYKNHHNVQRRLKNTILAALDIVKKCDADSKCTVPPFTHSTLDWVTSDIIYKYLYDKTKDESLDFSERREWLNILKIRVELSANDRFVFRKDESIKVASNKFLLPLNIDIFAEGARQVKELIEKSWSQSGISVQILPTSRIDGIFRIDISETPGERAFVSYRDKLMQLYSPTRSGTLIHEMGHILGLRDSYYTWFNPSTCEYVNEYNNADIMSVSSEGKVLPSHIEEIKNGYSN